MINIVSFVCDQTNLFDFKRQISSEISLNVMDWQTGSRDFIAKGLLPARDNSDERWIFLWDDSPFSFGSAEPYIRVYLRARQESIYYACIGDYWKDTFPEFCVKRLGAMFLKPDKTPDVKMLLEHAFFIQVGTMDGIERLMKAVR